MDAFAWLYADELKLLFKSLNFQNDLSKLMNWNVANIMLINASKTTCISFKGHNQVDINSVPFENIMNHSDLGVLISHNLKWEPHLKLKLSKASKSFFFLKQSIQWSLPSRVKLSLYSSTVLSVLLYASPVWNANFTILRKLELFQKRCFFWVFGKTKSYEFHLMNNWVLPISLLIEYRTFCLLVDLLDLKYTFDLSRFICFQEPTRSNRKRYWNPLTWTSHPSNSHPDSFFVRAVRSYNYLHRHNIIEPGLVGMKKKIKNFLINKTFNINSRCSYFICCTCSSCKDLVSLC